MTDRATPDRAAAPAPLAERLREMIDEWEKFEMVGIGPAGLCAMQYCIGDLKDALANAYRTPTLLAALDGREAWNEAGNEAVEAAKRIVALHEMPRKRPTIEELERLLQQPDGPAVTINPDGSISADVSDALVVARALLRALTRPQPAGEAGK